MSDAEGPGDSTLTLLWRSSNPPWGVVRKVLSNAEYAIVMDDLNGDYREVEVSVLQRVGREWDELFSLDDAGYPDDEDGGLGGGSTLAHDGHWYSFLCGRNRPGSVIPLVLGTKAIEVVTRTDGWWFYVVQNDDDLNLHNAF